MKKYLFLIFVGLFFIQGCAGLWNAAGKGGDWIYVDSDSILSPLPELAGYEKNYKIGEAKTVFIGQEIIQVKAYTKAQSAYIQEVTSLQDLTIDAQYGIDTYKIRIKKNVKYPIAEAVNVEGQTFYVIRTSDDETWGVLMDAHGDIDKKGIYNRYRKMIYRSSSILITPDNFKFSVQKKIIDTQIIPGLSFDFIYSGQNDISLNMTYREYTSDNLARPSFYQNLTYQANAKQIRFKDFVIQIHDVSNEKITYTILADGLK